MADIDGDGDKDFLMMEDSFSPFRRFRNVSRFGRGCGDPMNAAPVMSSTLLTPGNANFSVTMSNAPANSPCLLAVSRGGYTNLNGPCQVAIDFSAANLILPLGAFGITSTDAFGTATVPLPIPADPGLIGLTLFGQWGVLDPFAPGGVALTQAGTFIIW
jgi:hypothetical protein